MRRINAMSEELSLLLKQGEEGKLWQGGSWCTTRLQNVPTDGDNQYLYIYF